MKWINLKVVLSICIFFLAVACEQESGLQGDVDFPWPQTDGDEEVVLGISTCNQLEFNFMPEGEGKVSACGISLYGEGTLVKAVAFTEDTPPQFVITSYKDGQGTEYWPWTEGTEIPLNDGDSHTLSVRYTSTGSCRVEGEIQITTDLELVKIPIVAAPEAESSLSVTPSYIDFGVVSFNAADPESSTKQASLTFSNSAQAGAGSFTISALALDSGSKTHFTFDSASSCAAPFELAPGDQKECGIEFTPTAAGEHNGLLALSTEGEASSCNTKVHLYGNACVPDCQGKECGDDGCEGSCGGCPEGEVCYEFACCQPDCDGKECGDDGCGGSCGDCPDGNWECVDFVCECIPYCENRECGDDGCGGSCGGCYGSQVCVAGNCCDCKSGKCCDGCNIKESGSVCDRSVEVSYSCSGGCGGEALRRTADRVCTGYSTECNGPLVYDEWETRDNCRESEHCETDYESYARCEFISYCCNNECSEYGDSTCVGMTQYKTCTKDSQGCLVWSRTMDCPVNSNCYSGQCQ